MENKSIVCYFSVTGTTKGVANKISQYLNSDLFEIKPIQKYTSQDLDWENQRSRTSIEMEDDYCRPKIIEKINNIQQYQKIILGFPIWWNLPPRIINSFIEENMLENKEIYLFATSGSSSIENSCHYLKNEYKNINIIGCKLMHSYSTEKDFEKLISK